MGIQQKKKRKNKREINFFGKRFQTILDNSFSSKFVCKFLLILSSLKAMFLKIELKWYCDNGPSCSAHNRIKKSGGILAPLG